MNGKTVCITGANSGIGYHTALELARQGAKIIMGVRDPEKGNGAISAILQEVPGADLAVFPLDLGSRISIEAFARDVVENTQHLDVLINNAGVMYDTFQTTADGFECQIGINHFGPFLLTHLLLDLLRRAPASRVINVSSSAHFGAKIDFERFRSGRGKYRGMPAYAQSKLANVIFTREMARRYPEIRSYSLHPGVVATRIVRPGRGGWLLTLGWNLMKPFSFSPKRGAKTSIFLATAHPAPEPNGQYFDEHQKAMRPSRLAQDEALGRALWDMTVGMWREAGAAV